MGRFDLKAQWATSPGKETIKMSFCLAAAQKWESELHKFSANHWHDELLGEKGKGGFSLLSASFSSPTHFTLCKLYTYITSLCSYPLLVSRDAVTLALSELVRLLNVTDFQWYWSRLPSQGSEVIPVHLVSARKLGPAPSECPMYLSF